jgi:hypothetical protein
MAAGIVGQARRSWLGALSFVVVTGAATSGLVTSGQAVTTSVSAAAAPVFADDEPIGSGPAVRLRIVMLRPQAGEPCGLRIRGNVPC